MKKRIAWTTVVLSLTGGFAGTLAEFPRYSGETDDAPRFQRAVDACPCGTLTVPDGRYTFAQTVFVTNCCSIDMCPSARIEAVAAMEWMIKIDSTWQASPRQAPQGVNPSMFNLTYRGGTLDARGLASCLAIDNYRHFTLSDASFLNPKKYGVGIETTGRGYEMIARNVYCKTDMSGLAGNTGIFTNGGDSHYIDCVVVDCTVGIHLAKRGSNRLSRIHVWGGTLPPAHPGEISESLVQSVAFRIDASDTLLRDCYADTAEIGYYLTGWEVRMFGCSYTHSKRFGMKHSTVIYEPKGSVMLIGFFASKGTETAKVYDAAPGTSICAHDNIYRWFDAETDGPLPGCAQYEQTANDKFAEPFMPRNRIRVENK